MEGFAVGVLLGCRDDGLLLLVSVLGINDGEVDGTVLVS